MRYDDRKIVLSLTKKNKKDQKDPLKITNITNTKQYEIMSICYGT